MGNDVPRRMRRFYRQGVEPPVEEKGMSADEIPFDSVSSEPAEKGDIAKALALNEVERFKEEHKRLPKKEEYDQIANSIFSQLRDREQRKKVIEMLERKSERRIAAAAEKEVRGGAEGKKESKGRIDRKKERALRHARTVQGTPAGKADAVSSEPAAGNDFESGSLIEKELKGLSVEDLFSDEKKQGKEKKDLEVLEGEFNLEGMEDMGEGKGGQENCPKCGKPTGEIIFCPECGAAFCEKCAKSVEVVGNARNIVCPGCGKKIKK